MQITKPLDVLILNNVPAPYFDPLFEQIGRESGWRLTICYSSAWNRGVGWAEKSTAGVDAHRTIILDQKYPALSRLFGSFPAAAIALARFLFAERPGYLICYGYTLAPQMVALIYAMVTATRFALAGDANYFTDSTSGMKRWIKGIWLRLIVRQAASIISIGTANRMFWESYGAKPAQIFEAGFAVDNDFFKRECEKRRTEAAALRTGYGLDENIIFLYVGRLIKRKNVDLILRAFQELARDRAAIIIAGSGDERAALETLARGDRRIIFAGGVVPEELPLFYAMSDVLLLVADQEPWGLVVNEAMASGLAVIAHRHCGAAVDLVGSDNGVVIEDINVDELVKAMRLIMEDSGKLSQMKSNSTEKIKYWSIDRAAYGMIRAVEESAVPGIHSPIPRV
jgi:glycosyltransferase involved in cell wall biosynthesis